MSTQRTPEEQKLWQEIVITLKAKGDPSIWRDNKPEYIADRLLEKARECYGVKILALEKELETAKAERNKEGARVRAELLPKLAALEKERDEARAACAVLQMQN